MSDWQRFKTTRVYLHPPKAERLITLWREGKIMLGEVEVPINRPYGDLWAAGVWFVDSEGNIADINTSRYIVRDDGIPVHKLIFYLGGLECELECACPFDRKPTLFSKLTLRGKEGAAASESLGIMLRTGKEQKLIFGSPDVYDFYNPTLDNWYKNEASWRFDGQFSCGDLFFELTGAQNLSFDPELGRVLIDINLAAGEQQELYFVFGKGDKPDLCFDEAKAQTIADWSKELSKITKLPKAILRDGEKVKMIKNLSMQLLQCFCYGNEGDELYLRQGGLQRRIWTYEAMFVLEALGRIGDFSDYIEPAIDVYFNKYFTDSGEIVPLGMHWAMTTGTVLASFARYALVKGKDYFLKYRDKAMLCFEWIRETRNKKSYDGAVQPKDTFLLKDSCDMVDGLFPPMSPCDNPLVFQAWLSTDGNNIIGMREFSKACSYFGDERADEVKAEYEAYRAVMQSVLDRLVDEASDTDEMRIPYAPLGDTEEIIKRYSFSPSIGFMLDALRPEPKIYEKIINYYTRRGFMHGGLYNKMPHHVRPEREFIWYVCGQEYGWFKCMFEHSDLKRAKELVKDNIYFAMSEDYYMLERYHQKSVWYAPWSPNASCNGRVITMLLDLSKYE